MVTTGLRGWGFGVWGVCVCGGGAVSGFCDITANFPKSKAEAIKTLRTF